MIARQLCWICVVFFGLCVCMQNAEAADDSRHGVPFVYYLQNVTREVLEHINPAVAVVDPYDSHLSAQDIRDLQTIHQQKLFAYLSAGEVDPSRRDEKDGYYYHYEWDVAEWLLNVPREVQQNEQWGSRRVEFWHPKWLAIIAERVKAIVAFGYDGVMLDTVDTFMAYKTLYPQRDVAADMVCLVAMVKEIGRASNPHFQVLINGGMALYDAQCPDKHVVFLDMIDGQLKEETWMNETGEVKAPWTKDDLAYLKRALDADKPVFSIDYFTNDDVKTVHESRIKQYFAKAQAFGVIPYAADRNLGMFLEQNRAYYQDDAAWDVAKKYEITPQ